MKRIAPILLVLLLVIGASFGCSNKSESAAYGGYYYTDEAPAEYYYETADAVAEPAAINTSYAMEPEYGKTAGTSPALSNRKIIRNANISVETLSFDEFLVQLSATVGEYGGYVESSSVGGRTMRYDHQLRYANYVIRIPADRLDDFLNTVSGLGNVTSVNTSLRDVTTNYVDSEKHLEALRTEQAALLDILSKADTVEDIITVQDRLTYVGYEIESYESILRTYDDQIALSTVTLNISEVERETPVEEETFGDEVSRRFHESLENVGNGFKNFGAWLFGNAPELIVILVILGGLVLIVVLVVKGVKKRIAKKRAKAANGEDPR